VHHAGVDRRAARDGLLDEAAIALV